ncbi:histone-lysine N-methyltransferase SETMAR [Plakobranchus ocellatus]|uniref:Histone-lysine N-methyltransferase SETMAR n=1 Tax=Plakobranchus ocellatus TaxID=259542 RepID=A0AAV4E0P1_9GAST|nr:histone-lysine N-methyltransferase SETMAR [Plakobranchus ocellatus]
MFIEKIVTGYESGGHHFDPESKCQSTEYKLRNSSSYKKLTVVSSARKALLTIVWYSEGINHIEFLKEGKTVNADQCVATLQKLRARLRRGRSRKTLGNTRVCRMKTLY